MAGTATSLRNGGLSIPKIKKVTFADSIQHVSLANRDVQNLLNDVSKNCLDVNFIKEMDILQVSMVHSSKLQSRYLQKRAEMKESGRSAQTLIDQLGFRFIGSGDKFRIAKDGLCANEKLSKLGKGDCGVYLTRYFDVEVKNAWCRGHQSSEIFIFKYFSGKCKSLKLGDSSSDIEPTPNYDSHVGNMLPNLSDALHVQFRKSLIYLYEYSDDCLPSEHPRHCLPYAIIKVRKKNKVEDSPRTVSVPRVTPLATSVTEPPCDHPNSSPSLETSKVNLSSTASSRQKQKLTPLLTLILDSAQQSPSEEGAKGSVNISTNSGMASGETQDVTSTENMKIVKMNGSKSQQEQTSSEGSNPQREKRTLPGEGTNKVSSNKASKNSHKDEYLKRFATATEKIEAEKHSKMLEYLKFIPLGEPEASDLHNSSSMPYVAKTAGLPRAENQTSKCSPFLIPGSNNSLTRRHAQHTAIAHHSSTCGKGSLLAADTWNPPSFADYTAGKLTFHRSASTSEGSHRNIDTTFCLRNQNVDPRLLRRSQSSGTSNSSNILPSNSPQSSRVEASRAPIKSALKNSRSGSQSGVKKIITISEYKQLKAREHLGSSGLSTSEDVAAVPEKSTADLNSILGHTIACNATDSSSQNSSSFTTQQSQKTQSRTPTIIEDKLPNSKALNSSLVSTAAVCNAASHCDTKTMLPTSQKNQGCESDYPGDNGPTTEVLVQEPKKASSQIPGSRSNIFNSFRDVNFQLVDSSPVDSPKTDGTSFNLDTCNKLISTLPVPKGQLSISVKDSLAVKNFLAERAQKGQLRTSVKDSPAVNDSLPGYVQNVQLTENEDCVPGNILAKPKLVANVQTNGDSTNKHVTSDVEATSKLIASDVEDSDNLVASYMEDTDELLVSDVDDTDGHVTSDIEDTSKLASSDFSPIHSISASMNQHTIITPIPWRHDQDLTSDSESEYSQSSEGEYDSCVEGNQLESEQLSQNDFERLYREQYGDKPLPKSLSMQEVDIECYLLALSDPDYQPLAIVVDCFQAKCDKFCKICETQLQHIPEHLLNPEEYLPETEEQTSVATALCGSTLETSLRGSTLETTEKSMQLPGVTNDSCTNVNQSNACGKPGIVSVTDSFQAGLSSNTDHAASSPEPSAVKCIDKFLAPVKCFMETGEQICVAGAQPGVSLEVQSGEESSRVVSCLETLRGQDSLPLSGSDNYISMGVNQPNETELNTFSQPAIVVKAHSFRTEPTPSRKSEANCSESRPKSESCSTNATETTPTSQSNSASTVRLVGLKDVPETSQKPPKKLSLVGAYSDTDSNNSDEDNCRVTKPTKENSLSSKLKVNSNGFGLGVNQRSLNNKIKKNTELHTSKELSEDRDLDPKSEEDLRERLLEETYLKGSLLQKIADQNVLKDKSNRISAQTPHILNKKHSVSMKDSSSDEETLREHLLTELYAKATLERKRQAVIDTIEVKIETLDTMAASGDNREHQDVINSLKHRAGGILPKPEPTSKSGSLRKHKQSGAGDKAASEQNHSAVSHTLTEDRNNLSDSSVLLSTQDKIKPQQDRCDHISSLQSLADKTGKDIQGISFHQKSADKTLERDRCAKISSHQPLVDKTSKCIPATENSNLKPGKDLHAKISKQAFADKTSKYAPANVSSNMTSGKDLLAKISSHQTLAEIMSQSAPANVSSNMKPGKDLHAKISSHQTLAEIMSESAPANVSSNMKPGKDLHAKISSQQTLAEIMSESAPANVSSNMTPRKDLHAKVLSHQTLADKTSKNVLATVSSNIDCKQNSFPEQSGTHEVQLVTREKPSLNSQCATQFSVQERKTGSVGVKVQVSSMTKVEQMELKTHNSSDKNHLLDQKRGATLRSSMAVCTEDAWNSSAKRSDHIKPHNSSSGVKLFLDKVRNSVEEKKHIDEELLAFQKLIEESNGNSKTTAHKNMNKKRLSNPSNLPCAKECNRMVTSCENKLGNVINTNSQEHPLSHVANNKAYTGQNKNVTIPETLQQGSQTCGRSISTAFVNAQAISGSSTALPTAADTWKDSLMPHQRIETARTNNSTTTYASSSEINNLIVANTRDTLFYRVQPDFPIAAVIEQPLLQPPYGDEDFRSVTRQNIPTLQQNIPTLQQNIPTLQQNIPSLMQQNIPALQQNFAVSNQERFSTNYSEQWKQWKQGIRNPSSHVHPYTPHQFYAQQNWVGPQSLPATTPIVDTGSTYMTYEDYGHVWPEGQMPMNTNTVLLDCHRPPEMGGMCSAAVAASLPAAREQCNVPIENYSTFVNCMEASYTQNQNAVTSNDRDSSFWLSSKRSNSDNISGLGFETAGSKVSDIPGLGDVPTHNHNDEEQRSYFEFKSTAPSLHETVSSAGGNAKAVWPEIYNSPKELTVVNKEKCRSILKSIKIASATDVSTEVMPYKIHNEDDYSDDDPADSSLPVSHGKEHADRCNEIEHSDSLCKIEKHSHSHCEIKKHSDSHCEIEEHSANVPQKVVEVPSTELPKLLLVHLDNVISKLSSTPQVDSKTNPLARLELWRETLVKRHIQVLDELSDDTQTKQPEHDQHDIQAYPTVGKSSLREIHNDEIADTHRGIGELVQPTEIQNKKVSLNTNTVSPKKECSEVDTGDVCVTPDLGKGLVGETASSSEGRQVDTPTLIKCTNSPGKGSGDINKSLNCSVNVGDDITKTSVSDKSPDSAPARPRSSSPDLLAVTSTKLLVMKEEVDLSVERKPQSPQKCDRSPVDDTLPEFNSVATFSEKNIDNPNKSSKFVDAKNNSEFPAYCKDSTEKLMSCSSTVGDVSVDNKPPGKETVSDSLSADPTDLDSSAPSNTTISVNSRGKVYLADVPLFALSIAREQILTEINNLNDPEVASLQKSSELITIEDNEDVNTLSSKDYGASLVREIEEGEISSSDSEVIEVESVPVQAGKLATIACTRKRKPSFYEDEFKKDRKKIVKHDPVKKEKSYSKIDNVNEINMKADDPHLRSDSDVIYISTDSDADSPTNRKAKTIFDRIRSIADEDSTVDKKDSIVNQKNSTVNKKDATSTANQSDRVVIKSSPKKKSGHEIHAQTQKSENIEKSGVKKKETVIDDDLSMDSISVSEWESDFSDKKKSGHEIIPQLKKAENKENSGVKKKETVIDDDLSLDSISVSEWDCDFAKISTSVSDTALLKPSVPAKQSTALQMSPELGRADRYRHPAQAGENLRKFAIFGENIVVQVFNEKSLIRERSQGTASSQVAIKHLDSKAQSDNNMSKKCKNLQLNVDTAKMSSTVSDQEVTLSNAEKLLLKASGSDSSLAMAKTQFNTFKQSFCSLLKNINCENKELLPNGSLEPTDGHKLPGKVPINVQKYINESVNCTEIRCHNTHSSVTAEVKSKDTDNSIKDLYRNLVCKSDQSLKLDSNKRCYRNIVKYSETETESDRSDSLTHVSTKVMNRDGGRPSETETSSYSDRDSYRNSMSPSSSDNKRRRTDRRSYDRSSSYSRKRRRSSSSSASYSRKRSLSRSQHSRSPSPLSRDSRSYYRSRHYRRDKRSSSSSRRRSRRSKSHSPSPYSRQKRRSSDRYSSSKYESRRSVSSSRSHDSSTPVGYRRHRSKSPSRYEGSESYSSRDTSGYKKCKYTKGESYSSKSKDDKVWSQVNKPKNQHPFDMLYSITNMNIQKQSQPQTSAVVNTSGVTAANLSSQNPTSSQVMASVRSTSGAANLSSQNPTSSQVMASVRSTSGAANLSSQNPTSSQVMASVRSTSGAANLSSQNPSSSQVMASVRSTSGAANLSSQNPTSSQVMTSVRSTSGAANLSSQNPTSSQVMASVRSTSGAANLSSQNPTSSQVMASVRSTCSQKASDQVKDGTKVDETHRSVGKEGSVIDTHKRAVEASRRSDKVTDYSEMLRSHRIAQSHPGNLKYLRMHDVTVRELIISQLGISITDELRSVLPYSLHTILSDRQYSKEERQRRCFEIIQCCMKFLKIPTDLVSKNSIEPVINSFGNPPFCDRLEHFSDDQILLEINVIKKCQVILDQQQAQVVVLSSYIKMLQGSQLNNSMLNKLGTYSGEPLPESLQVSVQDFTFIVPKEVIPEEIAMSIKDSLEESIDTLLELVQLADFGRAHFRLPEILLLEEEKFQRYSEGNCYLTLNKSLPKKVFTRLLTLKKRIQSLEGDPQKSEEEKYACSRQLIGERVSVLMQHVGSVTHKRINKLRTLYNHLTECKTYIKRVIGYEGYRKLLLFDTYINALKQHYDALNDEYMRQSYSEYYD